MRKFIVMGLGGFALLIILGMGVVALTGSDEAIKKLNLIGDLAFFRIVLYVALVAGWWLLSPMLLKRVTDDQEDPDGKPTDKDVTVIQAQWWKVAVFLIFFEVVVVRQLGAS